VENPEWTAENFRNAKRGLDGLAELIGEQYVAPLRKVGRPKQAAPKSNGTLRLSPEVWAGLKASGRGYSARVDALLKQALAEGRL